MHASESFEACTVAAAICQCRRHSLGASVQGQAQEATGRRPRHYLYRCAYGVLPAICAPGPACTRLARTRQLQTAWRALQPAVCCAGPQQHAPMPQWEVTRCRSGARRPLALIAAGRGSTEWKCSQSTRGLKSGEAAGGLTIGVNTWLGKTSCRVWYRRMRIRFWLVLYM